MFKEGIIRPLDSRKDVVDEDQDREEAMIKETLNREEWEAAMKADAAAEMADAIDRHELWLEYKAWEMDNRLFGPDKKANEGVEKKLFINQDSDDDGLGETTAHDLYGRFEEIRKQSKAKKKGQ